MSWSGPAADAAFAAELAQLRLQAGLSRLALAEQVGIRPHDVDLSEMGQRSLDVVELFHWCQACDASLDAFAERMDQRLAMAGVASRH